MSDLVPFTGAELFQTCWFNNSLDSRQGLRARLHRRSLPQTFQGPSGAGLARQLAAWVWHGGPERAMWEKMDLFQLHLEHRKFFYQFLKLTRFIGLWKRGEQVLRSKWSSNEEGAFRQLHSIFK
ncbi:hypothetical protein X797_010383 [Metarhizium robertsii]|uniref:Uncharacterized protein n=2 Tax=Metarhizium robertsii TaxID=568076 RepID=A0A0B2XDK7_METRA|nr:uncharacterized protein MAA_11596 [Metarhizium robertsii ARSEF 23]EXU96571.1 hypothetical protein X797_010383 [Metarhizium robertsii]KHO10835.1 hypothetical protein MAA_11596 [Metarhizium robertsii ARSEF 23]